MAARDASKRGDRAKKDVADWMAWIVEEEATLLPNLSELESERAELIERYAAIKEQRRLSFEEMRKLYGRLYLLTE